MNVTKKLITALEKVFEREIAGSVLQSKAKIYEQLEAEGLIQKRTLRLGVDRFGTIEVTGYVLTIAGNYLYCSNYERYLTPEERDELEKAV